MDLSNILTSSSSIDPLLSKSMASNALRKSSTLVLKSVPNFFTIAFWISLLKQISRKLCFMLGVELYKVKKSFAAISYSLHSLLSQTPVVFLGCPVIKACSPHIEPEFTFRMCLPVSPLIAISPFSTMKSDLPSSPNENSTSPLDNFRSKRFFWRRKIFKARSRSRARSCSLKVILVSDPPTLFIYLRKYSFEMRMTCTGVRHRIVALRPLLSSKAPSPNNSPCERVVLNPALVDTSTVPLLMK
mmetsp:Transcript_12045/g.25648  ORF Transcript_12045/g.25648 Transcript_12045/m.25648 type:complete len:244 (-) Transcript_12045:1895-2626(-)